MSSSETTEDRELMDATVPSSRVDLDDAPPLDRDDVPPLDAADEVLLDEPSVALITRARATLPPPLPARGRGATVPPPVPVRAPTATVPPHIVARGSATTVPQPIPSRARRSSSVPPPIPARGSTNVIVNLSVAPTASDASPGGAGGTDFDVDVELTPIPPPRRWSEAFPTAPVELQDDEPALVRDAAHPAVVAPALPAAVAPALPAVVAPALPAVAAPDLFGTHRPSYLDEPTEDIAPRRRLPILRWALAAVIAGGIFGFGLVVMRGGSDRAPASASAGDPTPRTSIAAAPAVEPVAPTPVAEPVAPTPVAEPVAPTPVAEPVAPTPAVDPVAPPAVDPVAPPPAAESRAPQSAPPAPAAEPARRTAESHVRMTSEPAGATVTLVDRGTMSVIGLTPLDVPVDRSRSYDVVLTLPGYQTKIAALRAGAEQLAIDLAPVGDKRRKRSTPQRSVSQRAEPAPAAPAARRGTGTLMVSSKPPCEIVIDGVATVLNTPQRALKLTAGKHKVTLFNLRYDIDSTFDVVIHPGKATKLVRDFTAQMQRSAQR